MPRHRSPSCWPILITFLFSATAPTLAQCPQSRQHIDFGGVVRGGLPSNWIEVATTSTLGSYAHIRAIDDFEITGLAPSTLVGCTIQLLVTGRLAGLSTGHLTGAAGAGGILVASNTSTDSAEVTFSTDTPPELLVSQSLNLSVSLPAETVFRLEFELWLQTELATTGSELRAELRFLNLPDQAGVRSCTGFRQNPVSTVPQTWTRIKQLYRGPEPPID